MALAVHTVQAALRTTTGTQDFTVSGAGTCVAALFVVVGGITNGTARDDMIVSIGATDGTNHAVSAITDNHGVGTTDTYRRGATDEVIQLLYPSTGEIDAEANFDSFITDGVRINVANAPAAAFLVEVWLFFGDVEAKVGTHESAASGGTNNIADFGFTNNAECDVLIAFSHTTSFGDTSSSANCMAFGFAANNASIEQGAVSFQVADSKSTSQTGGYASSNRIISNIALDAVSRALSVSSFSAGASSDQVAIKHYAGTDAGSLWFGYLALKFTGTNKFKVGFADSPTSTGNTTLGGTSFTPQFAAIAAGLKTALSDTVVSQSSGSVAYCAMDDTREFSAAITSEDSQGTTDTQSLADNTAINLPDDDGTTELVAAFTSFQSTGVQLNFTTVDTSARKMLMLLIEEDAGGGGTTQAIGQATEVNSAFAVAGLKTAAIGQASSIESAFATPIGKTLAVGQSQEVDSSPGVLGGAKQGALGQAAEASSAFSVSSGLVVSVGQATENDSAFAISGAKAGALALATEFEVAFGVVVEGGAPIEISATLIPITRRRRR